MTFDPKQPFAEVFGETPDGSRYVQFGKRYRGDFSEIDGEAADLADEAEEADTAETTADSADTAETTADSADTAETTADSASPKPKTGKAAKAAAADLA